MAPHIFQRASALSSAKSCLTPFWPESVTNRPSDNTFFAPLLSLSLCLTPYLSLAPIVCTSLCPFSPQALVSFDSCHPFGTTCTVQWWTGRASIKAQGVQYTAWCTVWDLWVKELFKKRGRPSWKYGCAASNSTLHEFDLVPGRVEAPITNIIE